MLVKHTAQEALFYGKLIVHTIIRGWKLTSFCAIFRLRKQNKSILFAYLSDSTVQCNRGLSNME